MSKKHNKLMLKQLLGTITREEAHELEALLAADPDARARFDEYRKSWEHKEQNAPEFVLHKSAPRYTMAPVRETIKRRIPKPRIPDVKIPVEAAAEVAAEVRKNKSKIAEGIAVSLVCLSSFFLFLGLKEYPELYKADRVNKTIALKDSSQVTLTPGSAVKVSGHFQKETRTVYLYGDAHFKVEKTLQPFIVKTSNAEVHAAGNSFLVRADEDAEQSEVMALRGKVNVTLKGNPWRKVTLSPGQKGVIDKNGKTVFITEFDSVNALAWRDRILVFKKTPLEDAIPTLEDYFKVRFELENPDIADCTLSRTFTDPNIMDVIEVLRRGLGLKVTREPGVIILEGKGCKIGKTKRR